MKETAPLKTAGSLKTAKPLRPLLMPACRLLACLMLFGTLLAGCAKTPPPDEEPVAETPGSSKAETPAPPSSSGELSDDLYSYALQLDGVVYTLPTPYAEFKANGWLLEDDILSQTLEPSQYSLGIIAKNGGHLVMLSFVNNSTDVVRLEDADVGRVSLDELNAEAGTELLLPGGITFGASHEDIIAAYGEPSDVQEGSLIRSLTYSTDGYSEVVFLIQVETNLVNQIDVENLIAREQGGSGSGSGSSKGADADAPAAVNEYQAPAGLGDSWNSFNVKYDGALYHLPAPVSEFVKNGWVIASDENEILDAQSSTVGFEIRKGNQTLRTEAYNYADTAQPLKYCFITSVEYYEYGAQIGIELAKGLSEQSTIDDFIAAYGEPTSKEESAPLAIYEFGKIWENLVVSVNTDTGAVVKVSLSHTPKAWND
ncbi:MAG: hypothetical protein LBO07_05125 [Coriobacteriales bacterium]|jgi:hypothetical protein|nr:hypothetical protein [Coriobacteriales bacterium]